MSSQSGSDRTSRARYSGRGMKIALNEKASIVVLDMDTPGGELGHPRNHAEIIATLERFDGTIITY